MKNIRVKFNKKGDMVYISHLDLMRLFHRAFRRAGIMVKHTEGFNPQPKLAFATALALGTSSDGEYMDVELEQDIELNEFIEILNKSLPEGIKILKASEKTGKESIMSLIEWGQYIVKFNSNGAYDAQELNSEIEKFLALEEIIELKEKKKKKQITTREVNIRENIKKLELLTIENNEIVLKLFLKTGSNGNLKPETVVQKLAEYQNLDFDLNSMLTHRVDLFIEVNGNIVNPI